jgi:predicted dehydrogenase
MSPSPLRVGLVGAGGNMRLRHVPGLRALPNVALVAVCNRRPESTAAAARELGIPQTFATWQEVVASPDVDAVVIGTWPYLHCPITLAALEAGKHVLTEARMALNAAEAQRMRDAARRHPRLVCQVVPSPYGLKGHAVMRELLDGGFVGGLREVQVVGWTSALADPATPRSWRQDAVLSGVNMLTLGIVQETLARWAPRPARVMAQTHAFIAERVDTGSGARLPVETPDSVQVLAVLAGGARASYHFTGVAPFGQHLAITLAGSAGVLHYDLVTDRIRGARRGAPLPSARPEDLPEIPIPPGRAGVWTVEADWARSIREGAPVGFTTFDEGVAYMDFTEAVALSAATGAAVTLPADGPPAP